MMIIAIIVSPVHDSCTYLSHDVVNALGGTILHGMKRAARYHLDTHQMMHLTRKLGIESQPDIGPQ